MKKRKVNSTIKKIKEKFTLKKIRSLGDLKKTKSKKSSLSLTNLTSSAFSNEKLRYLEKKKLSDMLLLISKINRLYVQKLNIDDKLKDRISRNLNELKNFYNTRESLKHLCNDKKSFLYKNLSINSVKSINNFTKENKILIEKLMNENSLNITCGKYKVRLNSTFYYLSKVCFLTDETEFLGMFNYFNIEDEFKSTVKNIKIISKGDILPNIKDFEKLKELSNDITDCYKQILVFTTEQLRENSVRDTTRVKYKHTNLLGKDGYFKKDFPFPEQIEKQKKSFDKRNKTIKDKKKKLKNKF